MKMSNDIFLRKDSHMETQAKEKKKWKTPHTFVILVVIIIIAAVATYIVPAGEFVHARRRNRTETDGSLLTSRRIVVRLQYRRKGLLSRIVYLAQWIKMYRLPTTAIYIKSTP